MDGSNDWPPTAGNGEGPESATIGNRCNQNSSTTVLPKRDNFCASLKDLVGEGDWTLNAHPVIDPVIQDVGGHRHRNTPPELRHGAPVRVDLLHAQQFNVVDAQGNCDWRRHAHGWILPVPKWRLTLG